jgi:SAM-dependent methyltransferase
MVPQALRENRPVLYEDRRRAGSFGEDAVQYDRARPRYPESLVDAVIEGLDSPDVLDVGCGTGIASSQFQSRGLVVLGLEPDPRMAAVARGKGVAVEESVFESWNARGREFDLIISAQAWHWIDPSLGIPKAANLLTPPGRFAVFWNQGAYPSGVQPLVSDIYRRHAPAIDRHSVLLGNPVSGRIADASAAMTGEAEFGEPEVRAFRWHRRFTSDEWLDNVTTHSDHRTMPHDQLAALLASLRQMVDGLGGGITIEYVTWLAMATRTDR